jgi:hypothetical protein
MKKIALSLLMIALLFVLSNKSNAEFALGYETLVILPHALTANIYDKDSGLGLKASADFGSSFISLATTLSFIMGTLGLGDIKDVSFYSLCLTKDMQQSKDFRNYFKFGAFMLTGKVQGVIKSGIIPDFAIGMEWQKLWGSSMAFTTELCYPEMLTLGLKCYL